MDLLSPKAPSNPPSRLGAWPDSPAQRGKFYACNDPMHPGEKLCVMSWDSWVDTGSHIAKSDQTLKLQNGKIIELKATNNALVAQLADANRRLDNLRHARRKEKRVDLEKDYPELTQAATLAADPTFNPFTTGNQK